MDIPRPPKRYKTIVNPDFLKPGMNGERQYSFNALRLGYAHCMCHYEQHPMYYEPMDILLQQLRVYLEKQLTLHLKDSATGTYK